MSNPYSLNYMLIFCRFLFVDLNIRYLCELPTVGDVLTELERIQEAQTTDKPMDPTYDRIVDVVRNQSTACATLAIRTLAWIVKAQRILAIYELQIAVSLKTNMTKLEKMYMPDEEKLIDLCHGLVVMDDIRKTVHLTHFTAQEYLNRKDIIPQNSDTILAIACTTYLPFDEFKKHDCFWCRSYYLPCDTHSFFKYAVANLSFHLNSSDQESTVEVFERFLENEGNVSSYLKKHSSYFVLMPSQPSSLLVASALGHTAMVKRLLNNGCDISTADQKLLTSLHLASHIGHLELVKLLLENGANPNAVDKSNDTPLHMATWIGRMEIARFLLDSGADVTLAGNNLNTPLHYATTGGHLDLIKLLLEKGANPNAVGRSNDTPLHLAAERGHTKIAQLLLDNGADATFAGRYLYTPLHWAATKGNLDAFKLLLEKGANPNAIDKWKNTPLHLAGQNGHTDVARLLLDSGADATLANDQMSTPLQVL
jgi:ankyrin repeat protein